MLFYHTLDYKFYIFLIGLNNKIDDNGQSDVNGTSKDEGKSSSEQSDADVEDNLEDVPRPSDSHATSAGAQAVAHTAANFAAYHMESGYNSEKVISSDSIRTSPVDLDDEKPGRAPARVDDDSLPFDPKPETPLETLSNPDSGVASPEATKHNSTETVDDVDSNSDPPASRPPFSETDLERPASRRSFAPEYSNEVVSRGISLRGSKNLLEAEPRIERRADPVPETDDRTEIGDRLEKLELKPEAPPPPAPTLPLPLPLPPPFTGFPRYVADEDECSVHSCLAQFTALELLTGNNKVACERCTKRANGDDGDGKNVYTNATKRFLVSSPPAVLILHLKRFQLGPRCLFRKMSKHVEFSTTLDLAPFCAIEKVRRLPNASRDQTSVLYSLYGVVEHSGGMHGGHYVAYVKLRAGSGSSAGFLPHGANRPEPDADSDTSLSGYESGESPGPAPDRAPVAPSGRWFYVSDSMVQEIAEEKVLRAQAYLLFYERIL